MKIIYIIKLLVFALFLELMSLIVAYWVGIRLERVSMMVISLFSVYALFEFLFRIMQKQKKAWYQIKYFGFSAIKIFVILLLAYLFLKPESIGDRYEALFFLFNYLAFLIYDITIKVKFINNNTN